MQNAVPQLPERCFAARRELALLPLNKSARHRVFLKDAVLFVGKAA